MTIFSGNRRDERRGSFAGQCFSARVVRRCHDSRQRPAEMSAASPNRRVRSGVIMGRKLFGGAALVFVAGLRFWPREKRNRVPKKTRTLAKGNRQGLLPYT